MENSKGKILKEFDEFEPIYAAFTRKIEFLISELLDSANVQIHSVTSRAKGRASLSGKLERSPEKYEKLADITDLCGVRITCWFLDQIPMVEKIIKENFEIYDKLSVDKREVMEADRFGYVSIHYIISLSSTRKGLGEFKNYADLRVEIQIRTILQHAWAEIEHDLGYKSKIEVPKNLKRRFYRLAGLFELADDEFQRLRIDIENYSKEVEEKIVNRQKDILIDKVSLDRYMETSDIVSEIDKKILGFFGPNYTLMPPGYSLEDRLKILAFFNISTIEELEEVLVSRADEIATLANHWINGPKDTVSTIHMGISIFYLGYLLALDTNDEKRIEQYVEVMSFDPDTKADVVNRLLSFSKDLAKSIDSPK